MRIGDTWKSRVLNQEFEVLSDEARMVPGSGRWAGERFSGHLAARYPDGCLALIALSAKPEGYPFDFVFL